MPGTKITPQAAMTLAAIAPTGAAARPSGETLQAQTTRVASGVKQQLSAHTTWELQWLALSPDNANMAYIALNKEPASNQVAVVIRGTDATLADIMEDFDVSTVVPFTAGGSKTPVSVSKGAMEAFTQVANMQPADADPAAQRSLVGALKAVLDKAPPDATVFVVGHSLGGCVATMVALYLKAQTWPKPPSFGVLTFAAPTAGLADFAAYFDSQSWSQCERHVNHYDLVPHAWDKLGDVLKDPVTGQPWYPDAGPRMTDAVKQLITGIMGIPGYHKYAQPKLVTEWNTEYKIRDPFLSAQSTQDFLGQVAFQHANLTYMVLLGAFVELDKAPKVTGVSPSFGEAGIQVTVEGSGFAAFAPKDTAVDFGVVACDPGSYEIKSDAQILVHQVPDGAGIVDVRVTNPLGTSAGSPASQFAYGGPEPVTVTRVEVNKLVGAVAITGTGFTDQAAVYFGLVQAQDVKLNPQGQLTAPIPPSGPAGTTVDITVVVNGYSSPTSPADQYSYPA